MKGTSFHVLLTCFDTYKLALPRTQGSVSAEAVRLSDDVFAHNPAADAGLAQPHCCQSGCLQAEETLTRLAGRVNQWNAAVAPQPGEPSAGERPADSGPEGHRAQLDRATQAVEACRAAEKAAAESEKAQHM